MKNKTEFIRFISGGETIERKSNSRHIVWKKIVVLFLVILLLSTIKLTINAQDNKTDLNYTSIDNYIETEMKKGELKGLALGIVKGDDVLYLKGYGTVGNRKPVTIHTPFCIGSVTKTFTALAIRQLVSEGKINIHDYIDKYINDFQPTFKKRAVKITIFQLLTHTSGITKIQGGAPYLYNTHYSIKKVVDKSKRLKLGRLPGGTYEYSNLNYVILGRIIELVSNQTYEDYIKTNIFDKLVMNHSYLSERKAKNNKLSDGYTIIFGFPLKTHFSYPFGSAPAGFAYSSIEDMTNYMICYLNKGYYKGTSVIENNKLVAPRDSMENSFLSNWYDEYWFPNNGYPKTDLYLDSYGHSGLTPNFSSSFLVNQKSRYAVVVLCNTVDQANFFQNDSDSTTICKGIMEYIEQGKLPQNTILSKNYIQIIWLILTVVILLVYSTICIRSIHWMEKHNKRKILYIIFIGINFIVPIATLVVIPIFYDSTWSWLRVLSPVVSFLILLAMIWLILLGCCLIFTKLVWHKK